MTVPRIYQFQSFVMDFFQRYGRHQLPWRQHQSPYFVLVSEIMLQQTQVDRVVPKFNQFVTAFPHLSSLAAASVAEVIELWQGLGYNRRGLNVQRAAQVIQTQFNGQVPSTTEELLSLPGIGPYTAAAIQAFAFNQPTIVIETNIRTVFIHHFFPQAYNVTDDDLKPLIEQTLLKDNPRNWYAALMDYGSFLKQVIPNPSRHSRHYVKQSPFAGSMRQVRGQLLKVLANGKPITSERLLAAMPFESDKVRQALQSLEAEGFLIITEDQVSLRK